MSTRHAAGTFHLRDSNSQRTVSDRQGRDWEKSESFETSTLGASVSHPQVPSHWTLNTQPAAKVKRAEENKANGC